MHHTINLHMNRGRYILCHVVSQKPIKPCSPGLGYDDVLCGLIGASMVSHHLAKLLPGEGASAGREGYWLGPAW